MPTTLLDSQFATLEEPGVDEPSIRVEVGPPVGAVVDEIRSRLHLKP